MGRGAFEPPDRTAATTKPPGFDDIEQDRYTDPEDDEGEEGRPQKIVIKLADGRERTIQSMMATTFWSPDGRQLSAAQFVEKLFGELPRLFKNEDELKRLWSEPKTRKALLAQLSEAGFDGENLAEIRKLIDAEKSDLFDVLAYIAYARQPITWAERVDARRNKIMASYEEKLRGFLDFVLGEYVIRGDEELDPDKLGKLLELKYHTVSDAAAELGSVAAIRDAFSGFQPYLYDARG
jgi:type I restriction enzyme, R subunit